MPRKRRLIAEHFKPDGTPKRPFDTAAEAHEFKTEENRRQNARRRRRSQPSHRVYRCSFCGKFHLATIKNKGIAED